MSQLRDGAIVPVGEMHAEKATNSLPGPSKVHLKLYC